MAAYASKSLDFLHLSEASQLTLNHTMKAVQGVNEGLIATDKYQTDRDDGVILSIAMLAFSEVGFAAWSLFADDSADCSAVIAPLWQERCCATALDWLEGTGKT